MILDNGTTILLKRKFNVSVEDLFNCFTDVKAWKGWWKSLDVVHLDFFEGGEIKFSWKHSSAQKTGRILELKKNEILRFTWNSVGPETTSLDSCHSSVKDTEVIFSFSKIDEKVSELRLTHKLKKKEHGLNSHYEGWTWALLDLDQRLHSEERAGQPTRSVSLERIFNAPVNRVYELWTNPELLNKWFNTKNHTENYNYTKLKVKECYALDYHDVSGKETGVPGTLFRIIGEYKEIVPNQKLVFSWVDEDFLYESIVTVTFTELGDKTKVQLVHGGVYENEWIQRFESGWGHCLNAQSELLNR